MSRCLCASRACPTHALDVLSPSHIACVMACNNTNNACQKPKAGKAWPLADGAQIWVDSGSTARATHPPIGAMGASGASTIPASVRPTMCSIICDRAGLYAYAPKCRRHSTTTTSTPALAARVCTVDSATVDIASARLWPCTALHVLDVLARCA